MNYIGFDLGDGESSVAILEHESDIEPRQQEICGATSIISAVGMLGDDIVIGEAACIKQEVKDRQVRFKSRYLTSESAGRAIRLFAKGIIHELSKKGISLDVQYSTIIGCPAGWSIPDRNRYRELLQDTGFPNVTIVSESRAAFLYAKYARDVRADSALLNDSTLVIDIGSSTTDFAYIINGHETNVGVYGDIYLGGGVIDAYILKAAVKASPQRKQIEQVFTESKSWYSYCEFAARRLKETYFSDEAYWQNHICEKAVNIYYDGVQSLTISITPEIIWRIINEPLLELGGRSFCACLQDALNNSAQLTKENPPRLLLLTGGASRMMFFRDQCKDTFADATIVCCPEPEHSIAKGLAYSGRIDANLRAFRDEVGSFSKSGEVEKLVKAYLPELIPQVTAVLTDIIIEQAVTTVVDQWRSGAIIKLNEIDKSLEKKIIDVVSAQTTKEALTPVLVEWTKNLCAKLQDHIDDICDSYNVPREEMSLRRVTAGTDELTVKFHISQIFRLDIIGNIVSIIVGAITGMICGGAGTALIASGFIGIIVGAVIGIIAIKIGWKKAKELIMDADIPAVVRHTIPRPVLVNSIDKQKKKLNESLIKALAGKEDFNKELCSSIVSEISNQLEQMAKVAEMQID